MKLNKKFAGITAAAITVSSMLSGLTFLTGDASAASVMTPDQITQGMGTGWNIGNTLDATGADETSWGNPKITQELIDAVNNKGFDSVRVPVTWYNHVEESKDANGEITYTIDGDYLARVKEVIDYAYNDDMYVILNLHHEEWINRPDFPTAYDEMSNRLTQMWEQIATYFKDYDQHLIFEGMNEPRQTESTIEWTGNEACYEVVNKLDQDFVNTVRSVDSDYKDTRLLMIPSYCASAYSSIYSYLEVPDDDYVAVSVHAYSPYNFAMGDEHDSFTDSHKGQLDQIFKDIQYYFTDKDIPVVLGEYSASNYDNLEAREAWADYYLTWAKKLGIPCFLWDNNADTNPSNPAEAHGYINRNTLEWYPKSEGVVDTIMKVMNDDSIVWGSEKHRPSYKHYFDSADKIVLDENKNGIELNEGCSNAKMMEDGYISANKEIAIKYSGKALPVIAFMDKSWGGWTEISPYDVDEENGIAYYSFDSIQSSWGDTSTIASMCVKITSDSTKAYEVAVIPAAELEVPDVTTTTTTETEPTETTTTEETTVTTTVTDPTETTTETTDVTTDDTTETTVTTAETSDTTVDSTTSDVTPSGEKGDVNGDGKVNIVDLMTIAQHIASIKTIDNDAEFDRADANSDGVVNIMDLMTVARVVAGIA